MDLDPRRFAEWIRSSPEGRAIAISRTNVLVRGTESVTEGVVVALTPYLRRPIESYRQWKKPPEATGAGTLIVPDVERLEPSEQRRLFDWLDQTDRRVQVVAMTPSILFSLVESRRFLEALYYRLNTVYIDTD